MELGNMMFGCSRGEYPIERTKWIEYHWEQLTDALGHSYRVDDLFENDTFLVQPYNWNPECTCGFDKQLDEFLASTPHAEHCYQRELDRRIEQSGKFSRNEWNGWTSGRGYPDPVKEEITEQLCKERGLSYPQGCMVHCDCGRNQAVSDFVESIGGDHADHCEFVQPNFKFKPSGFQLMWYKYPFRDSYSNRPLDRDEWRKMIEQCIESLDKK